MELFIKVNLFLFLGQIKKDDKNNEYMNCINKFAKSANLIHIQRAGDEESQKLTFDIVMKKI